MEASPPYKTVFDLRTSLSKDDAISAILFGMKKTISGVSEAECDRQWHTQHDQRAEENYEPSLMEMLINSRETAEAEYSCAKYENISEAIIAEKLAELRGCESDIQKARHYMCLIDDELAKGESSELRIDSNATKSPNFPFITIVSLEQWVESMLKNNLENTDDEAQKGNTDDEEQKEEHAGKAETSLLITFAFLVELLAETDKKSYQNNSGEPNASAIGKAIEERAKTYKKDKTQKASSNSQSDESVRKRIAGAIKTRNEDF